MAAFAPGMHRRLLVVVGIVLAATIVGLILLWPSRADLPAAEPLEPAYPGRIVEVVTTEGDVDPFTGGLSTMETVTVEILGGPAEGEVRTLDPVPTDLYPPMRPGDMVNLERVRIGDDVEYYIQDFRRLPALSWLVGLFALAVLAIGRWHGLRSLLGLALSLGIIVTFVVPAILDGGSPPVVAMVGAMAIMIVTLYLTHGINEMTTSAVVGTAAALLLTIALALLFIDLGRITGLASEDAVYARFQIEGLDLRGLVLAGLIIAALGVLDDVTISQASTVFALHDTDRTLAWKALFGRAMRVGRDHIASVVNTLVLAYAGASLALLVLFSVGGRPVGDIINSEILAEEIIKTLVGSLGLIAAVPLTTALATTIALQRDADAPPAPTGHAHGHPNVHGPGAGAAPGLAIRTATEAVAADTANRADTDPAEPHDDEVARRSWARYLAEQRRRDEGRDDPTDE